LQFGEKWSFDMLKKTFTFLFFWETAVLLMPMGTGPKLSLPIAHSPDELITQVTKDPAHDYHVKWSPDGKMLAFASLRSGEPKIWLVPVEEGEATLLETGLSGDHHISLAPDGKRIAFDARWEGVPNIFTIPLEGGQPKRLSGNGKPDFQPYWSPDGTRIGFMSNRRGKRDVWITAVSGGVPFCFKAESESPTERRLPSLRIVPGIRIFGSRK
jgi:Tol biopolymer transport system component